MVICLLNFVLLLFIVCTYFLQPSQRRLCFYYIHHHLHLTSIFQAIMGWTGFLNGSFPSVTVLRYLFFYLLELLVTRSCWASLYPWYLVALSFYICWSFSVSILSTWPNLMRYICCMILAILPMPSLSLRSVDFLSLVA